MEFFNFEPSDFQVLEDIEFDETIQRPESIRFYTLEEQVVDAFEHMIPRGRVSRFVLNQIRDDVERMESLYKTHILPTANEYTLRQPVFSQHLSWVSPVYSSDSLGVYNWQTDWNSLYENVSARGFYPRMISALPRPYVAAKQGQVYSIETPTEFVDTNGNAPLRVLPVYTRTKAILHEDRTLEITPLPIQGTADDVRIVGYYLQKRPLDIPNPLLDHPFLKGNEPTFLETEAPLQDVIPSIDAIMTHAVPTTRDPYVEGQPYLKLYDIALQNIPWEQWKSKFPPADVLEARPPTDPLPFPKPSSDAPSEKIVNAYNTTYSPGMSARQWLATQLDAGELIIRLLLSESINNGSVEMTPQLPLPSYPASSPDDCSLLGKPFQDFANTGILRRIIEVIDKATDKYKVYYQCVPLEFIKQERARAGYVNRLQWKESTGEEMKKTHVKALALATPIPEPRNKEIPFQKHPSRPDSVLRQEVQVVMDDEQRLPEDRLADIRELVKTNTQFVDNVYLDMDSNFVVCAHTLAVLGGDLAANKDAFYATWTVKLDGFRVCKFCGQQVVPMDYVVQDEYDDDGFLIRNADSLQEKTFTGEGIVSFTTSIQSLRTMLDLANPVDDTCFLLLTLLQVLPNAEMFLTYVKKGRELATKQFGTKADDKANKFRGAIGFAVTILLLQSHMPILVPRRSFGARPLKLNGYPRDATTPDEYSILDSLMLVLQKTFESYPESFKGSSLSFLRGVLNNPKDMKKTVTVLLGALLKDPAIKTALETAKAHMDSMPIVEQPKTLIPIVPPPKEMNILKGYPECPSARLIWTNERPPKIVQDAVPLIPGLHAATNKTLLDPSPSQRVSTRVVPKPEIAARYKLKPKSTRIPIRDSYRLNLMLVSRLADIFTLPNPIRTVDPTQNPAELRDLAQGLVFEVIKSIQEDPVKQAKLNELLSKDVALYTLLADVKEQKEAANKLRASERLQFVQKMSEKTDQEREVIGELLKIGLAPYIISNKERELFARTAEKLQQELQQEETDLTREVARGYEDDGDEFVGGVDNGDYGDQQAYPEGQDYRQPSFNDDQETSI